MDEKYVKYIWIILKNAIQEIQKDNCGLSHEQLYHKAYEVVMNKHGFRMYNGLRELLTNHLKQKLLQELLVNLDNNFLSKLNEAWIEHQTSMLMLSDMLGYMDRTYAEPRGLDSVYNLGLKLFRFEIVEISEIEKALREKLLEMIKEERLGAQINHSEMKNACTMLIKLGINSRYFYEKIFETPFLLQTEEYYNAKFNELKPFPDKEIKSLISKESSRASIYLDQETVKRIEQVLKRIIEKHN